MAAKAKVAKAGKAPKAKRTFKDDWDKIPSKGQLIALAIRAFESGTPIVIPCSRDGAREALGYENDAKAA